MLQFVDSNTHSNTRFAWYLWRFWEEYSDPEMVVFSGSRDLSPGVNYLLSSDYVAASICLFL